MSELPSTLSPAAARWKSPLCLVMFTCEHKVCSGVWQLQRVVHQDASADDQLLVVITISSAAVLICCVQV